MKIFMFLIFCLVFLSCKKEKEEDVVTVIGEKNKNFEVVINDPELSFLANSKDSLDLNSDGNDDIVFIKTSVPTFNGFSTVTLILVKNGIQIALSNVNNHPDTLSLKTLLDENLIWSDSESSNMVLHGLGCNSKQMYCMNRANFINVYDKYIGFKIGQKYGWIKVDNTLSELKIKEYTVLK